MPKSEKQKLKMLYIQKMLLEDTDESHTLTVNEIIERLTVLGIKAERKSIYDDIADLQAFGMDIVCIRSRANKYFCGTRDFELPELKLLVDAVVASKFITKNKSMELIKKLEGLTCYYQGRELQRQVQVQNRIKNMHETIYYVVDKLHQAIVKKKQIAFNYWEWNLEKQEKVRKNGDKYTTNPCALCWNNDNYYLVTYSNKYKNFVHYRVDKMADVRILETACDFIGMDKKFDINTHTNKYFGMYSGKAEKVAIYFDNSLAGAAIDRFGKDVAIRKSDDTGFTVVVDIVASPVFFAWIVGFGNKAQILTPSALRKEFKDYLRDIGKLY
jgi:predicted DNA-binding transcriptional regulator YafY